MIFDNVYLKKEHITAVSQVKTDTKQVMVKFHLWKENDYRTETDYYFIVYTCINKPFRFEGKDEAEMEARRQKLLDMLEEK